MAQLSQFSTPKGPRLFFEKHIFDPFFDAGFLVTKWPIFKAFWDLRGAKMAPNGLKLGSFHLFCAPQMV